MQKSINRNGINLVYYIYPGKKIPILFIHGTGSNSSIWKPYLNALKDHHIITVDLRGHGRSSRGKVITEEFVNDCIEIIKEEKLKEVVVMGNSFGAVIANEIAKKNSKCKATILASLSSKEYFRARLLCSITFTLISKVASLINSKRKLRFQDYWRFGHIAQWRYFFVDLRGTSVTTWFSSAVQSWKTSADVAKMKIPTLILQGTTDLLIKVRKLRSESIKNPKVEFKEIESHHHIVTSEHTYVIKLIKEFIKGI